MHRVFVDEAGDFNFKADSSGGSKYFILTSMSVPADQTCYLTTWSRHLQQMPWPAEDTLITAATLFTGGKYRGLKGVRAAMIESIETHVPAAAHELSIVPCHADPLLQAVDYCCWAIQRRYERGDPRSYEMIGARIVTETVWPAG